MVYAWGGVNASVEVQLRDCLLICLLVIVHLCPGLNAVTNFANFTILRFGFKRNKFCDFSLNSTRYTKIGPQCVLGVLCSNLIYLSVGMLFSNISV